MLKVVRNLLSCVCLLLVLAFLFSATPTHAADLNASVGINPSLTLTLPTADLDLNLNPATTTFDYKDLPISISTNNETGYIMTVTTANDSTDLVNTSDSNVVLETLPALAGGYTDSTFVVNKWGYKNGLSNNYFPFTSGDTVLQNSTYTNEDSTTLRFATKIDYMQEEGTYSTTFSFNLVVNPTYKTMQNLDPTLCTATPREVIDERDDQMYTIQRFSSGDCWMTKNLLFTGTSLDPSTTNVNTAKTISYGNLSSGNSFTQARYAIGTDNNGDPTVWYNYAAASAMNIASGSTTTEATESLCPAGWRLPTNAEGQALVTAIGLTPSLFNPVSGGIYYSGAPIYTQNGTWYASTAYDSTERWYTYYDGDANELRAGHNTREMGRFIRCVLKDTRTLSDITYMQDINSQIAANTANGATKSLKDTRDNQSYTVAKINGNLWMTQNLRYIGDTGSPSGSMVMKSTTSNISADTTITYSDIDGAADSYTNAMIHDSGNATNGVWYNYIAATATTITGSSNNNAQVYDVCPAGWRLPSSSEQSSVISYKTLFNPVPGGAYNNGTFNRPDYGYWFSSTAHTTYGSGRYVLGYENDSLYLTYCTPYYVCGCNIRCIAK